MKTLSLSRKGTGKLSQQIGMQILLNCDHAQNKQEHFWHCCTPFGQVSHRAGNMLDTNMHKPLFVGSYAKKRWMRLPI